MVLAFRLANLLVGYLCGRQTVECLTIVMGCYVLCFHEFCFIMWLLTTSPIVYVLGKSNEHLSSWYHFAYFLLVTAAGRQLKPGRGDECICRRLVQRHSFGPLLQASERLMLSTLEMQDENKANAARSILQPKLRQNNNKEAS